MRKQAGGALKIVVRLFGNDSLQVWHCGGEVTHLNRADGAPVEGVRCVRAGCDRSIECLASLGNLAIVHVEIAQLFVVSGRRIVANYGFELANALAAGGDFVGLTGQIDIGQRRDEEVHNPPDPPPEKKDVETKRIRAPAHEGDDRHYLEQEAPWVKERA